ncbi:hypothetical protein RHMOL_Rhmol03G0033900 [Rhododendron molle]|uniref:Uncharacterized protein n=1 Tax=Rhododendron molle TaxID=49168 RepID=A0ACC0PB21_RHOML|nr:hypothetical protein RHMOL_Rhmol03G0033900 [Rhododendron molle]
MFENRPYSNHAFTSSKQEENAIYQEEVFGLLSQKYMSCFQLVPRNANGFGTQYYWLAITTLSTVQTVVER